MQELTIISSILGSVKTATEITKLLRDSDLSLEKAEVKLKLADLVVALADTKMQLADVQELLREKDQKIAELEDAFKIKGQIVCPKHYDAYYQTDENGDPKGNPFCLGCWENKQKLNRLVKSTKHLTNKVCPSCGQQYNGRAVGYIK